jgi:hypothetical protein
MDHTDKRLFETNVIRFREGRVVPTFFLPLSTTASKSRGEMTATFLNAKLYIFVAYSRSRR